MALCRFADGAGMYDVTPIENMFLLEFLPTAPDGFLRVYLYMRMLALHPELGETIEDVAKALRMEQDAVLHAMEYWERQGLVCRLSDQPPTYAFASVHGSGVLNPMDNDYYEYRDFNANLQALFGADNLLSPKYYSMAYDWLNVFHFTQEAVLRMVEARVLRSKGKKISLSWAFKKLDEQAKTWANRGVQTLEDVEQALIYDERIDRTAKAVLKQLAISREPSVDEQKLVATWLDDWGYTHEQILSACAETTKARNPTMAYLNSILENGRKDNDVFKATQAALHILNPYESAPSEPQMACYRKLMADGFEPETVLLAATRCRNRGRFRFDDLTHMLEQWKKEGLFRCDAAEAYLQERDRVFEEVRALLQKAGTDRNPRLSDLNLYEEWRTVHSKELIDYAAECARGMDKPMLYINKRLAEWAEGGAKTVAEAAALQQNRASSAGRPADSRNLALNYEQRKYTEADFADLFVDLEKEYGEGGDET